MRKNKNRKNPFIILALMAFSLSVFSVGTSAHAADVDPKCVDSNICAAPAPAFKLTTNFIKEVLLAIKTVGTRDPYLGKFVSPSRFEGSEFKPPAKEGLVSKFMRNIKQALQTVAAVAAIFTNVENLGGIKDFVGGIMIIFKNRVFLRDYKTLMEIDSMVSDKKYELGLGGGFTANLNEANRKMFQKIFDKYGPEGENLFSKAVIGNNATYRQIVMLMDRINGSLKTFIASPNLWTRQFTSEFTKNKLFVGSPEIEIAFNPLMISGMEADYQCARGLTKCDDSRTKFKSNITKIAKTFGSGSLDVGKTIAAATKRLAIAMTRNKFLSQEEKDAKLKKQRELLQSQLGLRMPPQPSSGGFLGLGKFRDMIQNAKKKVKDGWKELQKDVSNGLDMIVSIGPTLKDRKKALTKLKEDVTLLNQTVDETKLSNEEKALKSLIDSWINPQKLNTSFYSNLDGSMNAIYDQASADNTSMFLADNVDVTYQFFEVLNLMKTTIDNVIGNRSKPDSLIKNLGEACEAQCANAGGKCFY